MASNINPSSVDGTYPIAGRDNDSQGFRDNFTNIKTALTNAKTEIEDLQTKAVLKSALTGTTLDNDGSGAVLNDYEFRDISETRVEQGTTSGTVTLNYESGPYHTLTTSGNVTLAVSNMPAAGKVGRVRLEITVASIAHTLTFDNSKSWIGLVQLPGFDSSTYAMTFQRTGTYVFELSTDDGGSTFAIGSLTQNSRSVDYRTISASTGSTGDQEGMLAADDNYIYVCTADYDGSTNIWKRFNLPTGSW